MFNAQPDYPPAAAARGIEGYVIVRFDVTAAGQVDNVEVVESSNGIFDKAAVNATFRARYKPRTVDGVPLPTAGIRKLYRFEMKN